MELECAREGSGSIDYSVKNEIIKPPLFQKYRYPTEIGSLHYPKCWCLNTCHACHVLEKKVWEKFKWSKIVLHLLFFYVLNVCYGDRGDFEVNVSFSLSK